MDIITITKDTFERYAPSAIDVESEIFDRMGIYFRIAYSSLANQMFGRTLSHSLPALFDDSTDEGTLDDPSERIKPATISEIRQMVEQYVVNAALYVAIPQLDVVLTNNGFGVVNTQSLAPASKERVERLRDCCLDARDEAYDNLLISLPGNSLTSSIKDTTAWKSATKSIIWTSQDFRRLCGDDSERNNRNALLEHKADILRAETFLRTAISIGQYESFIDMLRNGSVTDTEKEAMSMFFEAFSEIYGCVTGKEGRNHSVDRLLAYMDNNTTTFTSYAASLQYTARHSETFENSEDYSCYWL